MKRSRLGPHWILMFVAALSAAVFFYTRPLGAAEIGFPIYFEDSTLTLRAQTLNRVVYLPLVDVVRHLNLPYTDATALETFTIRGPNSQLTLTRNSSLIAIDDQIILLSSPILRENSQWLVPVDFLSDGLSRIAGIPFRYRPGSFRVFAGNVNPAEVAMNVQAVGAVTRLTVRSNRPVNLNMQRDNQLSRAVLILSPGPVAPVEERPGYRDRLVESIAFDDADGTPKIIIETGAGVGDVRVTSADERRIYFVDFLRDTSTENLPVPGGLDPNGPASAIRVIVIDPGHGGIDIGTQNAGTLEKDLTLTIARKLRETLQRRLHTTVLLTRDSDVALTSEARSAVANNNQADLFVSLHIGFSANTLDSASSIYLIQEDFASKLSPAATSDNRLFLPWFLGYRLSRISSEQMARILQEELSKTIPGGKFPVRTGPIAVLASATMPAIALEIGNLNNPVNSQAMLDDTFQARLISTIADAVERFAGVRQIGL